MRTVVVGGHSRNIGKTSVVAAIIAALPEFPWTAVKIAQHGHGICSASNEPCDCAIDLPDCPYAIDEEKNRDSGTDTARFLHSGARRSLWVRTPQGALATAMPALHQAIAGETHVIIESNSVMEFLQPDLYLFVLNPAVEDFKDSARRFFPRADASIVWSPDQTACPDELIRFVRSRLERE